MREIGALGVGHVANTHVPARSRQSVSRHERESTRDVGGLRMGVRRRSQFENSVVPPDSEQNVSAGHAFHTRLPPCLLKRMKQLRIIALND